MCVYARMHIRTCSRVYNTTTWGGAAFSSDRPWEEELSALQKTVKIVAEQVSKYPAKQVDSSVRAEAAYSKTYTSKHTCVLTPGNRVSKFTHLFRVS